MVRDNGLGTNFTFAHASNDTLRPWSFVIILFFDPYITIRDKDAIQDWIDQISRWFKFYTTDH